MKKFETIMKELENIDVTTLIEYFDFFNTKYEISQYDTAKDRHRIAIAHEFCKNLCSKKYDVSFRLNSECVIHLKSNDNASEHSVFRIYINRDNMLLEINSKVALSDNLLNIQVDEFVKARRFKNEKKTTFHLRLHYTDLSMNVEIIKYVLTIYKNYR